MTEAANGAAVGGNGAGQPVAGATSAPTTGGGLDWNKVNWNEFDPSVLPRSVIEKHPDFNGLRSAMDRRHSATEQRYQRQLQEAQQAAQAQVSQLQQLLAPHLNDGMKRDLQGWENQQRMAQLEQENRALRAYYGRQDMLANLSKTHGIPLDDLADVEEPAQAYEKIVGHQAQTLAGLQKQLAELTAKINGQAAVAAIPPMDQGAGAATTTQAQYQQRYDEAMRGRNTKLADQIQFEAIDKGIDLDLYSFRKKV
jgi:hypothetical protein